MSSNSGEQYLNRCRASVVNQRYTNREIILVDNHVRVIYKQNGDLSDVHNAGMNIVTGDLSALWTAMITLGQTCLSRWLRTWKDMAQTHSATNM